MKTAKQIDKIREDSEKNASLVDDVKRLERYKQHVEETKDADNNVLVWMPLSNGERQKIKIPASLIVDHFDSELTNKLTELG